VLRFAVVSATALVALVLIPSAPGAPECATKVLRDWSDDGQVGSKYSPPCYEEAIAALPTDLRDYTDAEDVITRALTSAVRASGQKRSAASPVSPPTVDPADRAVPPGLVVVASLALALLGAGAAARAVRRRRLAD
jgi:hypothetical protein